MTWKDLLSFPNTRITVVKNNSMLEEELQIAMEAIELIKEMDDPEVPAAIKVELLAEMGKCEEWLFPMKWNEPNDELNYYFSGFKLSSEEYVAARATIVFPDQVEYILLLCESELK